MSAIEVMTEPFQRTSYTLSTIAETGEQFSDFAPYVASIDDRGVVAFQATLQDGGSGVFTGDGGPITVIADSSTGLFREVSSHPDLDGRGSVCFYADLEAGHQAVFLVRNGEIATIADSAGPLGPTMNEAGAIAFRAPIAGGGSGVFASRGGAVTTIADTTGAFSGFQGLPVIDGNGSVTFRADLEGGGEGVYVSDGKYVTAVDETGSRFSSLGFFPCANDGGTVAFCADLHAGGSGVFTATEGEITTIMDTTGPFESFRGVLLDSEGRLVFYATPRGGELGIFTGHDPVEDCLLAVGLPLFGSTVADFALNPVSINDVGRLAIRVELSDERQFIFRADPVTPA